MHDVQAYWKKQNMTGYVLQQAGLIPIMWKMLVGGM